MCKKIQIYHKTNIFKGGFINVITKKEKVKLEGSSASQFCDNGAPMGPKVAQTFMSDNN
jgi:hypothetical protein